MAKQPASEPPRRRTFVLIVIAAIVGFLATVSVWAERQLLDNDTWTDTSTELLEDDDIREAVATFLVEQLYANVNVEAELRSVLPGDTKGLAAPAAGGLRTLAERAADEALERPRVQAIWEESNRAAHTQLLDLLEDREGTVANEQGQVTLDLRSLVDQIGSRLGIGGQIEERLPPDAAEIVVLRSDELDAAQDGVVVLRGLAILLSVLAIALYIAAVGLAGGWRRGALRTSGLSLALIGVAVLIARTLAGDAITTSLAGTASVEPAVNAAWGIATSLLADTGRALIFYGVAIVVAAWAAGPSRPAHRLRQALAPYLREPRIAYSALAVLIVIALLLRPREATSGLLSALILIALLAVGMEALRRRTVREFPHIEAADLDFSDDLAEAREGIGAALADARDAARGVFGGRRPSPRLRDTEARVDALERLDRLRQSGALTEVEFRREKKRILDQEQ